MANVVVTLISGLIICVGAVLAAISLITPGHGHLVEGIVWMFVGALGVVGLWRRAN